MKQSNGRFRKVRIFVEEESLTSLGCSPRRKEHDFLSFVAIAFQDLFLQVLNGQVNKETRIASLHLGNDPVLAFFVTHVGTPCRQGYADSLHKSVVLLDSILNGRYSREVYRAPVDPRA